MKPPPHAVSAVKAPSDANSRRPSVIQRLRCLPGRKSNPIIASAGAASGHQGPLLADAVMVPVAILSVEVADALPGVTEGGVKVPVAPVGMPVAESKTAFENVPFCALTVKV